MVGDLGFAMQFNGHGLAHSAAILGSDGPQSNNIKAFLMLTTSDNRLNNLLLNCLLPFFIHLKLKLLTQFPASNDEKYIYLKKIDISNIKLSD